MRALWFKAIFFFNLIFVINNDAFIIPPALSRNTCVNHPSILKMLNKNNESTVIKNIFNDFKIQNRTETKKQIKRYDFVIKLTEPDIIILKLYAYCIISFICYNYIIDTIINHYNK